MTKVCADCGREKPLDGFYPWKQSRDGRYLYCRPCAASRRLESRNRNLDRERAAKRARRAANPDKARQGDREQNLRRLYGIGTEEFDGLMGQQGGVCAICGAPPAESAKGRLAVDHDHKTGAVRGLLCSKCNLGLGAFLDDPVRLEAAMRYVEAHAAQVTWA